MRSKIFETQSKFQKIEVYERDKLGKTLYLSNMEQFSEADEHVYHETITKVPLSTHGKPNKVLVIGGGDGGTVRDALKFESVESIDVCEIDPKVVEVCREYFPQMAGSFDNPKVNLFHEDGSLFLKNANKTYDAIIVDSTDPDEPSKTLFCKEFYENLKLVSNKKTIIVLQFEGLFFNPQLLDEVVSSLYETFDYVDFFRCLYERGIDDDYTTFALCSQSDFDRPEGMDELFAFNKSVYKKIINFKKRINWLK